MQLVTVTMRVAVVDNASEDSIIAGIMGLQKAAEVMARRTYTGSMSDTEIAQIVEPLYANTRLTGWSVRSVDPVVLSKQVMGPVEQLNRFKPRVRIQTAHNLVVV